MTDFSLIETLRYEPEAGFIRLRLHLARLVRSARRLGISGADGAQAALLAAVKAGDGGAALRVRLKLFPDGHIEVKTAPFAPLPKIRSGGYGLPAPGSSRAIRCCATRPVAAPPMRQPAASSARARPTKFCF